MKINEFKNDRRKLTKLIITIIAMSLTYIIFAKTLLPKYKLIDIRNNTGSAIGKLTTQNEEYYSFWVDSGRKVEISLKTESGEATFDLFGPRSGYINPSLDGAVPFHAYREQNWQGFLALKGYYGIRIVGYKMNTSYKLKINTSGDQGEEWNPKAKLDWDRGILTLTRNRLIYEDGTVYTYKIISQDKEKKTVVAQLKLDEKKPKDSSAATITFIKLEVKGPPSNTTAIGFEGTELRVGIYSGKNFSEEHLMMESSYSLNSDY